MKQDERERVNTSTSMSKDVSVFNICANTKVMKEQEEYIVFKAPLAEVACRTMICQIVFKSNQSLASQSLHRTNSLLVSIKQ